MKAEGSEAEWEFEVKPLEEAEAHYPEKGISYLETGFPVRYISQNQTRKQGSV